MRSHTFDKIMAYLSQKYGKPQKTGQKGVRKQRSQSSETTSSIRWEVIFERAGETSSAGEHQRSIRTRSCCMSQAQH